jgi:8-oxo-dGTP pyrophosphatase MutT (NUDIX family)
MARRAALADARGVPVQPRRRSRLHRARDAVVRTAMQGGFRLMKVWWRVRRPTLEGVYVAVWHGERVLVIRNSYQRAYSFPSGRRGRAEPPARAAARELREEVGIEAAPEAFVHVAEWTLESDLASDHVHVFELRLDAEPVVAIDHREVVWAAFETLERARERRLLPAVSRYLADPPR